MLQIVNTIHAIDGSKSTEELRGVSYFETCLKILYRNNAGLLNLKKNKGWLLYDKSTKNNGKKRLWKTEKESTGQAVEEENFSLKSLKITLILI